MFIAQHFVGVRLGTCVLRAGLSKKLDPTFNTSAKKIFTEIWQDLKIFELLDEKNHFEP